MEPYSKPKMLKNISYYLFKSFKFYDIKGDYVAPVFFVVILAINFASYFLFGSESLNIDLTKPDSIEKLKIISSRAIMVSFATSMVVNFIAAGYMFAYICELKGQPYTLGESIAVTLRNSYKLVIASFAVSFYVPMYALSLRLPGIWSYIALGILTLLSVLFFILYCMLIFSSCYIQDRNKGLVKAMGESIRLSKGHKVEIFSIILIVKFISIMLTFSAVSFVASPGNELIQVFVESFLGTILSLVLIRVISLMYFDLQY